MFNNVIIEFFWHFPAYFWNFLLKAVARKYTEDSYERANNEKPHFMFLRNYVSATRCIFFFFGKLFFYLCLVPFIIISHDNMLKIQRKLHSQ